MLLCGLLRTDCIDSGVFSKHQSAYFRASHALGAAKTSCSLTPVGMYWFKLCQC